MIVSNATPLIYLTRMGHLNLLKEFFEKILIPKEVYREVVVGGKKQNAPDVFVIENALKEGWIEVKTVDRIQRLDEFGIDKGEGESISLALKMKHTNILVDQTHARVAAKTVGLTPRGTIFVLLQALKRKKISYDQYMDALRNLVVSGFRMSDEVYLEAVRMGEELTGR